MGMAASIPYYTVDDLDRFPDDGNRYELLDGVLLVTPAPNQMHQVIAARLIMLLGQGLASRGARVTGPGVVQRMPRTQLEPDVLVYAARWPVNAPWTAITGHWLAVEIFSRSSKVYDREFKRAAYLALGVREVWLVDASERTVETFSATRPPEVFHERVSLGVPELERIVEITLDELFEGMDDAMV